MWLSLIQSMIRPNMQGRKNIAMKHEQLGSKISVFQRPMELFPWTNFVFRPAALIRGLYLHMYLELASKARNVFPFLAPSSGF